MGHKRRFRNRTSDSGNTFLHGFRRGFGFEWIDVFKYSGFHTFKMRFDSEIICSQILVIERFTNRIDKTENLGFVLQRASTAPRHHKCFSEGVLSELSIELIGKNIPSRFSNRILMFGIVKWNCKLDFS